MLHGDVTGRIIRCFYQVYDELGVGFLESVYEHALAIALEDAGLPVARQHDVTVSFRGRPAGLFRVDLIVDNVVLVELKAARALLPIHQAQVINYLRATQLEVGLLLNFGPTATFQRLVFENTRKPVRVGPRSGPPWSSAAHSPSARSDDPSRQDTERKPAERGILRP